MLIAISRPNKSFQPTGLAVTWLAEQAACQPGAAGEPHMLDLIKNIIQN